jgi:anti-anti-sigma factor
MDEPVSPTLLDDSLLVTIRVARLFDPALVDLVDHHLQQAVAQERHLVLDLSRVRFLSSAMLGRLMLVWRDLAAKQRRLAIAGGSPTIIEILRIAGLDQRIELYDDAQQAGDALRGTRS